MDIEKIEKFIDIAKEKGVAELKYETKNEKYSVSFVSDQVASSYVQASKPVTETATSVTSSKNETEDGYINITSPFVGTFYRSPSPESPAYIEVGQKVSKGQVLCIVEAMKIMNEIETDLAGEIVQICVDNESYVEFGQVLFKIKK